MRKYFLLAVLAAAGFVACISRAPSGSIQTDSILLSNSILSDWTPVNTTTDQWQWKGDTLITAANGAGYLRSPQPMENFRLSFEAAGAAEESIDLILCGSALPDIGTPFPEGIPINLPNDTWTSYLIESSNERIRVFANNKLIFSNDRVPVKKGYLCLVQAGREKSFSKIKLVVLDPPKQEKDLTNPIMDTRFVPLYAGDQLDQWDMKPGHINHWTGQGWWINYDGKSQEKDKCLWTKKSYRDFELIADWRLTREPSPEWSPVVLPNGDNALNADGSIKQVLELYAGDTGIYLRGHSKNQINIGYRYLGSGEIYGYRVDKKMPAEVRAAVTPKVKADNFPGKWNRFIIRMKGDRLTVILNGITVIEDAQLPGIAAEGPIALQDDHASDNRFQFANLFIREL